MKVICFIIVLIVFVAISHCSPVPQDNAINQMPEVVCRQHMQRGQCRALISRWLYDVHTHSCVEFKYGGCGGNGNNFRAQRDCEAKCLGIK